MNLIHVIVFCALLFIVIATYGFLKQHYSVEQRLIRSMIQELRKLRKFEDLSRSETLQRFSFCTAYSMSLDEVAKHCAHAFGVLYCNCRKNHCREIERVGSDTLNCRFHCYRYGDFRVRILRRRIFDPRESVIDVILNP